MFTHRSGILHLLNPLTLRIIWQNLLEDDESVENLLKVPDIEIKLRYLIDTRPIDAAVILAKYVTPQPQFLTFRVYNAAPTEQLNLGKFCFLTLLPLFRRAAIAVSIKR